MVVFTFILLVSSLTVRSITITGDSLVKEKELRRVILLKEPRFFSKSKFHPEILGGDIETIRSVYFSHGFLEPSISSEFNIDSTGLVDIRIKIYEGKQTFVENITFIGNFVYNANNLKSIIKIKPGLPFNPFIIEDDYLNIINHYDQIGYHDARVTSDVDILNGANIRYNISEGERIYISEVIPIGASSINTERLKIATGLKSGTILTNTKIVEARKRLYNLDLLNRIRLREEDSDGRRNIIFILEPKEPITLSLRVGYSEYDRMKVAIIAKHNNLFGSLRRIIVSGKLGLREQNMELGYRNPITFGRWFENGFGLRVEQRKETGYKTRRFGGYTTIIPSPFYIRYDAEHIRIFAVEIENHISETFEWLRTLSVGLSLDKRDNPIHPNKGFFISNYLEFAGILPKAKSNFIKNEFRLRTFYTCIKPIVGLRFDIGIAKPFTPTEEIPIYSRFFLGGATSVRGYRERAIGPKDNDDNPLGGAMYILNSIEARIPILSRLSGVLFVDMGILEKKINIDKISPEVGFGLGFRLYTPIGPIRLDYARTLDRSGRIHFAIGESF